MTRALVAIAALVTLTAPVAADDYQQALRDYRARRYKLAATRLQRIVAASPSQAGAQNLLGWCRLQLGAIDAAGRRFGIAAKARPRWAEPVFGLGRVALAREAWAQAVNHFRTVARLDPSYEPMWTQNNLGWALSRQGKQAEAAAAYGRALATPAKQHAAKLYLNACRAQAALGRLDRAVMLAQQGTTRFPKEAWLWNELGWMRVRSGDKRAAEPAYARARQLAYRGQRPAHRTRFRLPFQGRWLVIQGNLGSYSHRSLRSAYSWDVRKVDAEGRAIRPHSGRLRNSHYYCFGEPVLAPAAGTVVKMRDGIPDNLPGKLNMKEAEGNYVVLRHTSGELTQFFHFKRGSVAVKQGQRVSAGQRLGLVGNSGHSTGPHLCFSLRDEKEITRPARFTSYLLDQAGGPKLVRGGVPAKGQIVQPAR